MALIVVCIPNSNNLFLLFAGMVVAAGKEFRNCIIDVNKNLCTPQPHMTISKGNQIICVHSLFYKNNEEKFLENVNQAWLVCLECRQCVVSNIRLPQVKKMHRNRSDVF